MKKKTFLKAAALMTALIMTFAAWSPAAQAFAASAKKTKTIPKIRKERASAATRSSFLKRAP